MHGWRETSRETPQRPTLFVLSTRGIHLGVLLRLWVPAGVKLDASPGFATVVNRMPVIAKVLFLYQKRRLRGTTKARVFRRKELNYNIFLPLIFIGDCNSMRVGTLDQRLEPAVEEYGLSWNRNNGWLHGTHQVVNPNRRK